MDLKTKTPSVVLPIHFRYQKPSLNKKFRKVMIKKPSLVYLTCGIEKHKITFEKQIKKDTWKTKTIYMDDISAEIQIRTSIFECEIPKKKNWNCEQIMKKIIVVLFLIFIGFAFAENKEPVGLHPSDISIAGHYEILKNMYAVSNATATAGSFLGGILGLIILCCCCVVLPCAVCLLAIVIFGIVVAIVGIAPILAILSPIFIALGLGTLIGANANNDKN
eukprot:gene11334-4502_t